ncbi:MAG: 1-acyl-sn-glycerol-3-phosphate acyltransferase [Nannocystis sp.]|nr:1-acyl-sn-glycerol-3-phosphate acyltransferase [Nannocystis sp.]
MRPLVAAIRAILAVTLRIFFKKIELRGVERVPTAGPVIFVLNHPNGLIDPVFLLCLAPRRVCFVAKAPLFKIPVVGALVRAFDSLPVQRRQDEASGVDNTETFKRARALLLGGGSLAIFPEGASHSDPRLRPLKTGVARIALGTGLADLKIVPAGLYYTDKAIFRSEAVVYFGEPLAVAAATPGEDGAPPEAAVRALTSAIERALSEVLLQADEAAALALISRAERAYSAAQAEQAAPALVDRFERRRRFIAGYHHLLEHEPEALSELVRRLDAYEAELTRLGLTPEHPSAAALRGGAIIRVGLSSFFILAALAPLAMVGTLVHYPAYRAIGALARRVARDEDDLLSTIKVLGALLLFPLTWALCAAAVGLRVGGPSAALALLLAPLSGWAALRFWERVDWLGAGARVAWIWLWRRSLLARLSAARAAIHAEIAAIERRYGAA